jgi:hypothetical protein
VGEASQAERRKNELGEWREEGFGNVDSGKEELERESRG